MALVTCECGRTFDVSSQLAARSTNPARLMRVCLDLFNRFGLTGTEIARRVGRKQSFVSKLLLIGQWVDEAVLACWEDSWQDEKAPHLTVADMDALRENAERKQTRTEQLAEYEKLIAAAVLVKRQTVEKHASRLR